MGQKSLTWNEFRKILRSFGVSEGKSRGKGSHTYFYKRFPEGEFGYPVPTHGNGCESAVRPLRQKEVPPHTGGLSPTMRILAGHNRPVWEGDRRHVGANWSARLLQSIKPSLFATGIFRRRATMLFGTI